MVNLNCRFYRSGMSFFLIWKCSRDRRMEKTITLEEALKRIEKLEKEE